MYIINKYCAWIFNKWCALSTRDVHELSTSDVHELSTSDVHELSTSDVHYQQVMYIINKWCTLSTNTVHELSTSDVHYQQVMYIINNWWTFLARDVIHHPGWHWIYLLLLSEYFTAAEVMACDCCENAQVQISLAAITVTRQRWKRGCSKLYIIILSLLASNYGFISK